MKTETRFAKHVQKRPRYDQTIGREVGEFMKIEHQTHTLESVVRYFAKGFEARVGEKDPKLLQYYVDPVKDTVVFILGTEALAAVTKQEKNI